MPKHNIEVLLSLDKRINFNHYQIEMACDNGIDYYLTTVNNDIEGNGGMATYPLSEDELEHLYNTIAEILNK